MPKKTKSEKSEELKAQKERRKELLKQSVWAMTLPPINPNDPDQVRQRIARYFQHCVEEGAIVGIEGLCNALKINRATFNSWLNGTARLGQEHQKICQEADQVIKSFMENATLSGDVSAIPSIFFLSNQHGYEQKTTVRAEQSQSVLETSTPEQLEKRYSTGSIIDVSFEEKQPKREIAENFERISIGNMQQKESVKEFVEVETEQEQEQEPQKEYEPIPRGRKPKKDITVKIKHI